MAGVRERDSISARALEFSILTAARTGEVLGARWCEIDLDARRVDDPGKQDEGEARAPRAAERSRGRDLQRLAIANYVSQAEQLIFPLSATWRCSNCCRAWAWQWLHRARVPLGLLRLGRDRTGYPRDLIEQRCADAHQGQERKRPTAEAMRSPSGRRMMAEWARFCEQVMVAAGANVTPLRA